MNPSPCWACLGLGLSVGGALFGFGVAVVMAAVTLGPILQLEAPGSMLVCWEGGANAVTTLWATFPRDTGVPKCAKVTKSPWPTAGFNYTVDNATEGSARKWYWALVPPPPSQASSAIVRLWFVADYGHRNSGQRTAVTRGKEAFLVARGPPWRPIHAVIAMGDLAYPNGTRSQLTSRFFGPNAAQLAAVPLFVAIGNHDSYSDNARTLLSMLRPPSAGGHSVGVASGSPRFYGVTLGPVHIIALDAYGSDRRPGGPMALWLAAELRAVAASSWSGALVATFHYPAVNGRGTGEGPWSNDMAATFLPILESGGVHLIVTGHIHSYQRTFLLRNGLVANSSRNSYSRRGVNTGYVHVTAGSTGALDVTVARRTALNAVSLLSPGSFICDFAAKALNCTQASPTGATVDAFVIAL